MSSVPSFREVTKAIDTFIPHASLPLPEDLAKVIEGYISRYDGKFDDSIADKVQAGLLSIYQKHVHGVPSRYAPFLNMARRFRPLIGQPAKVLQWWDLLLPCLDHLKDEKELAAEAQGAVLDILLADDANDRESPTNGAVAPVAEKLVLMWLEECQVVGRCSVVLENLKRQQLRDTLVIYGKKKPKGFMTVLNGFMVKAVWRARTLHLLADFIQSQPPHLYQVLQTGLFNTLTSICLLDTSSTVVSLALTVLTMLLPHMPSSLVPHLPHLFRIYSRALFWEREFMVTESGVEIEARQDAPTGDTGWDTVTYSPDFDDTSVSHLLNYYTILYGLYPINFMDYIRKPQRYLRHAELADADDMEVQPTEIRHASERFRRCHLLHENFYSLTIESEKTDFARWIKSEPAEVFADCMTLCVPVESGQSGEEAQPARARRVEDDLERDSADAPLLAGSPISNRFESEASRPSSQGSKHSKHSQRYCGYSAGIGPSAVGDAAVHSQGAVSGRRSRLQELIDSNRAIKSELNQTLTYESALSGVPSRQEWPGEKAQAQSTGMQEAGTCDNAQVGHLYRQILLLSNDLTFERFMKQQHLTHMGSLRRRKVKEAASEAETQNLMIANRHLKRVLEAVKESEMRLKKESDKSRTLAKKWESDLSSKLREIREERKKWMAEEEGLRREAGSAKAEAEQLRILVSEAEVREMGWKQSIQSVEANACELERLRKEVARLTVSERNFEAQEVASQAALVQRSEAESRAEMLQLKLVAREGDFQQAQRLYQSQILALNEKLHESLQHGSADKGMDHLGRS